MICVQALLIEVMLYGIPIPKLRVKVLISMQLITAFLPGAPKSGGHFPQFPLFILSNNKTNLPVFPLKELVHISSAKSGSRIT